MSTQSYEYPVNLFIEKLASGDPTPGGGGAAALAGAIGVALCSMVANLTSGKKKYAEYQQDIEVILDRTKVSCENLLALIQRDADVFAPLAQAYGIPKDDPTKPEVLERALHTACSVPMEILEEVYKVLDILDELCVKGSKIAISDVGVAASACRCAMESAVMNIYINTKLMQDRPYAEGINRRAGEIVSAGVPKCQKIYDEVLAAIR